MRRGGPPGRALRPGPGYAARDRCFGAAAARCERHRGGASRISLRSIQRLGGSLRGDGRAAPAAPGRPALSRSKPCPPRCSCCASPTRAGACCSALCSRCSSSPTTRTPRCTLRCATTLSCCSSTNSSPSVSAPSSKPRVCGAVASGRRSRRRLPARLRPNTAGAARRRPPARRTSHVDGGGARRAAGAARGRVQRAAGRTPACGIRAAAASNRSARLQRSRIAVPTGAPPQPPGSHARADPRRSQRRHRGCVGDSSRTTRAR